MAEAVNPTTSVESSAARDKSGPPRALLIGAGSILAIFILAGAILLGSEPGDAKSNLVTEATLEHEISAPSLADDRSLAMLVGLEERVAQLASANAQSRRNSERLLERIATLEGQPAPAAIRPSSSAAATPNGRLEARVLAVEAGITREGQARLDYQKLILERFARLESRQTQEEATRLAGQTQALARMKAIEGRVTKSEARH